MSRTFFLASVLPPLELKAPAEILFDKLVFLYEENLDSRDRKALSHLRSFIDLSNVCRVIEGKPIDMRGNFSEQEIDEGLLHNVFLPEELFHFLDTYESKEERIKNFPLFELLFLKQQAEKTVGFRSFYFRFQFELKVLLAHWRSIKMGDSVLESVGSELEEEDFIVHLKGIKEQKNWHFPEEFSGLKAILEKTDKNPEEQYEAIEAYKFARIQSYVQDKVFSMDYLLGYFALFVLVEDYQKLKVKQQHQWLETVCEGIG
ncbi:hypothetical protein COB21_01155 [Candidatus Aerophobetes bacterium]|uniref:DUF2764 family protein n=1 Tax=Aerophobetes bacterium TaxID=2030807 RepID=A0A2A4X6X9_UNCAE|nr:MAG: hypothetical protein COB21_01155 [Candidatus Aerophobetes bacterium]